MRLSKRGIITSIIIMVLLIGLTCFAVYMKSVTDYKNSVKELTIEEIDVSTVPDGTYIGECNVNFIYAKVEVLVENGKMKAINILEHKQERGLAAEVVVDRIVEEQRIDVDSISGATNSSVVLKKAVENALAEQRTE